MSAPSRNARQRKPSHFGSYCHSAPIGISATDNASIGAKGRGIGSDIQRRIGARTIRGCCPQTRGDFWMAYRSKRGGRACSPSAPIRNGGGLGEVALPIIDEITRVSGVATRRERL